MVLYMTADQGDTPPRIAEKEAAARKILLAKGVDPDGIADQGDIADDLGIPRRSVSWLRHQYRGPNGVRGKTLDPFPPPAKVIGGGRGNPVWMPRWKPLAWHLTRPQTGTHQEDDR